MNGKTKGFFWYDASRGGLAVDPSRPWQLCTWMGCLIGKFATAEQAESVANELQADDDAGTLPCNLSLWSKAHLLS